MAQPRLRIANPSGQSSAVSPRLLPDAVGVSSVNLRPGTGEMTPWLQPAALSGVTLGSGRKTLYRLGRSAGVQSPTNLYWLSWTAVVNVVRDFVVSDTSERTMYTGDGAPKWTNNILGVATAPYPTASRDLAIPKPDTAPTVTLVTDGATGDATTTFWAFSLVNDLGWESAPSLVSAGIAIKPGAVVSLGIGGYSLPSGNFGVTIIRWYRTQTNSAGTAEFMFVRQYAWGATGMQDDGRGVSEVLPTEGWLPLDANAKSLTLFGAQIAAATVDKSVRFCEPGYIYAWPIAYEYKLAHDPIGLAAFGQRLVALTTGGITVFTGIDPASMDQRDIHVPACQSARSIIQTDAGAAWASNSGIIWYGTDGAAVNLTAGWIKPEEFQAAYSPSTMHGAYFKGLLIYWFTGGTAGSGGFVIDPSNRAGGYFLSGYFDAAHWDESTERLFVLSGTTLSEWQPATGSPMTATFRSRVWRTPEVWEPEMVDITGDGTVALKVYVDGTLRMDKPALGLGEHRVPNGVWGRDFQVEITTTAPVSMIEVY